MFPKAHAAAYVTNAFRIAWFKVHQPKAYYAAYFTIRADEFDSDIMCYGKEKVINHHLDVPYRVLERKYSYDENGQHEENNGTKNMVIHGDNLEALKSLLPQYEGLIKCIYIDPPYNTGNAFDHYDDCLEHSIWLGLMRDRIDILYNLSFGVELKK